MNKMKGKNMLPVITLMVLSLFGCTSTNKNFSENSYKNPKPNKEIREEYVSIHPELNPRISGLIKSGIVGIGMSKEEVTASWGRPDHIKKTSEFGADEIWYYWDNPKFHPIVYFSGDIVVKTD
jgi:hypothetical protein